MKMRNPALVSFIAVLSLIVLFVLFNWVIDLSSSLILHAHFDKVTDLEVNAPVKFKGYQVGYVKNIEIDVVSSKIDVTLKLVDNIHVPKDAKVAIVNRNWIMGPTEIELTYEHACQEGDCLKNGDMIDAVNLGLTASGILDAAKDNAVVLGLAAWGLYSVVSSIVSSPTLQSGPSSSQSVDSIGH